MQQSVMGRRYIEGYTVRVAKNCTSTLSRTGMQTYRRDSVTRSCTGCVTSTTLAASISPTTMLRIGRTLAPLPCDLIMSKNSPRCLRHRIYPTILSAHRGTGHIKNRATPIQPRLTIRLTAISISSHHLKWRTVFQRPLRTLVLTRPSVRCKNTLRVFINPRKVRRVGLGSNGVTITELHRTSYTIKTLILLIISKRNAFYCRKAITSLPSMLSPSSMPQTSSKRRTQTCRKTTTDELLKVGKRLSLR